MIKSPTYYHFIVFFILYFFFNNLFLPQGLLYTTLLLPLFLYWLYKRHRIVSLLKWSVLLIIPIPFHLIAGVDWQSYLISSFLVLSTLVFLFTAMEAARVNRDNLEDIFSTVMVVNSVLLLVALVILPIPPARHILWDSIPMSQGLEAIPRLKLLAYEPSHYGLLMTPVFLYFFLKALTGKSSHPLFRLAAAAIPLMLTFSLGIIGALSLAILAGFAAYLNRFTSTSRRTIFYILVFLVMALAGLWIFWPGNPLFIRLENVIAGSDSSSKGRLVYSFMFARDLIMQHNPAMGVGPGQIKILAHDLIVNFYQYTGDYADTVRIPNSMAEMLATYGFFGFILKIALVTWFFFRLKVYRNLYSLTLFLFIFIYQFTGSFVVNAAEIGAWAIAFGSRPGAFERDSLNREER